MRTTVTIPEELLGDLMKFSEANTRTEAVNRAVEGWVKQQRLARLKALRGKLSIDDVDLETAELAELNDLER